MISIRYNKTVTLVSGNKVWTINKKSDFWQYVDSLKAFKIIADCNHNQIIKKLTDKGFNLDIDKNYGWDWDIKIIATK